VIDEPARREVSGVRDLTETFLARIPRWQEKINAFITVMSESALAEADALDSARATQSGREPVQGMVVAVKDDIEVADVRCTVGSALLRNYVPRVDAGVVRSLRAGGAVILGKLLLSEFALGSTCDNAHYGPVRNPWDPRRYPGGSSGGSAAAVAADLCVAALGSDAGGSIRIPAALCGVSGMRPTFGSVPSEGAHEIAPSLETIGPLARLVTDLARLYLTIGLPSPERRSVIEAVAYGEGAEVRGLRIGVPRTFFFDEVDGEVVHAVRRAADALALLGADLTDIDLPGADATIPAGKRMIVTEAYAIHEKNLDVAGECYGVEVRERMLTGRDVTGPQLARDYRACRLWAQQLNRAFAGVDVILTPTVGFGAKPMSGTSMVEETAKLSRLTMPFSVAGGPSLSVPCGFTSGGLPIGVQLAAGPWRDDLVLLVGAAYQRATDWHRRRPEMPQTASDAFPRPHECG
jgi:aspartyl-tRNA(Asn)/glutamyl-tRNA(Gln) amidotransferase subunit A